MRCLREWLMTGFAFVGLVAVTALTVWAQPPGPPREQGGPPQGQPPGPRGGQPPGPPPGGVGGPGFGFGFGGLADLARRSDVRKELELLDDQIQKLDKLNETRGERMRQMFSGMEDVPREQRFEKMRELGQKEQQQTERELEQILLPHQMRRLKQLELQTRSRGGVQALLGDRAAEELGLSPEQKEKLQKRAAELEEQLRQKTAELRKQNQDELLRLLTPQQRAKWKDLVGDPFEFQRLEPPRPGGPGGGRGGSQGGGPGGGSGGGPQRPPR
jgi:hypothetical protein